MKSCGLILILGVLFGLSSYAEPIRLGSSIQTAETTLDSKGYQRGALSIVHVDTIREFIGLPKKEEKDLENLKIWQVDQGNLIVSYVVSTGSITHLSFFICDERPKATRKEFRFVVESFDPNTGILVIKTETKNPENKPEQPSPTTR